MEVSTESNENHAVLVTNCPWLAGSRDSRSLFGTRLAFVPWGWTVEQDGSFTDIVTEASFTDPPATTAIEENFAFKAFGARLCLEDIDTFAQTWRAVAPEDSQTELMPSLDRVRTAAIALAACGASDDQEHRSELDTLLATRRIIAKYPGRQEHPASQYSGDIESLSTSTWRLLQMVKGFCVLLQDFKTLSAAAATFPELRRAWNAKAMDAHSVAIESFASDRHVLDQLNSLKASTSIESLSNTARRLAKDYMSARNGARRKLDELGAQTPWQGRVVAVKWNKPLPHVSRLSTLFRYRGIDRHRIAVTASSRAVQSQTGEPTGSAASVEHKGPVFYFSHEDTLYLDPNLISSLTLTLHRPLYPDSTLQIQLQYIDDGAWRRGPVTRPFDTRFVFGSDIRKRVPGTRRIETPQSQHVLELDMLPSDITKEYDRLDRCHWTSLLTAGPLRDTDNPHKLLFEPPPPPPTATDL